MKLAWLTDIHLDAVGFDDRMAFYKTIKEACVDAIMITGDIGESTSVEHFLTEISSLDIQIYFVLGNHDYYKGSIPNTRNIMFFNDEIMYLTHSVDGEYLENKAYLVGQDCWADGRNGNYAQSHVRLNDSKYIQELANARKIDEVEMFCDTGEFKLKYRHVLKKMQELADADASALEKQILSLTRSNAKKILIAMHVPPFAENAYYNGKMSDDNYLPFFSSKVTGDMLLRVCGAHPDIEFQGYCGHSHGKSVYQPLPNLIVKGGEAMYGHPQIQEIIEI